MDLDTMLWRYNEEDCFVFGSREGRDEKYEMILHSLGQPKRGCSTYHQRQ